MTYQVGMRDGGWEIVSTVSRSLATFGGLRMESLTVEEAHVMVGLLEAYDRGTDDGGRERLDALSSPARHRDRERHLHGPPAESRASGP